MPDLEGPEECASLILWKLPNMGTRCWSTELCFLKMKKESLPELFSVSDALKHLGAV